MNLKEFSEQYPDMEITEEQEKQIRKFLNIKKNKKWKPKQDELYFYVDCWGDVDDTVFDENNNADAYRFFTNNCFKTREEAEFRLEQIKVYYELKNFADEHNDEIDWNKTKYKYHICDEYTSKTTSKRCISINKIMLIQSIGQIYFSSDEIVQQAIAKVGADRIKKYLFGVEDE